MPDTQDTSTHTIQTGKSSTRGDEHIGSQPEDSIPLLEGDVMRKHLPVIFGIGVICFYLFMIASYFVWR